MSERATAGLACWVHGLEDPVRAVEEAWVWADALEAVAAFDVGGRVFGPLLRRGWVRWIPRAFERPDPHLARLRRADDGQTLTLQQFRAGLRRLGSEEFPEPEEYVVLGRLLRLALDAMEGEQTEFRNLVLGWVALHRDAEFAVAPFRTAILNVLDPIRVEPAPPDMDGFGPMPAVERIRVGAPRKRWSRLAALHHVLNARSTGHAEPHDFELGVDGRTLTALSALFKAGARR